MQSKHIFSYFSLLNLAALSLSLFFLFSSIDHYPFWDDESSVSWFADNYNQFGKIIGYDGQNAFFYRNGALLNQNLEYNNPPLDIYYIAWIQRVFGKGVVIERLAFIWLGVLSLGLFFLFLRNFLECKIHRLVSFSLLCLSINFILFSKNCRYYALTLFLALILINIAIYLSKAKDSKWRIILIFLYGISGYLLFLSHFTQGLFWIVCTVFFYFKVSEVSLISWLKSNLEFILINILLIGIIGWYIYSHRVWDRPDLALDYPWYQKVGLLSIWLIHDLNRYLVFPIIFIVLGIFFHWKNRLFFTQNFKILIQTILIFLCMSILLSPQNVRNSGSFDFRYIYSVLPFLLIVSASFLSKLIYLNYRIGICFTLVYLFSSALFYIPTSTPFRLPLWSYYQEKNQSYKSASSEILNYLDSVQNVRKIATFPSYFNTQILDYYSSKFQITHTLDSNSQFANSRMIDSLGLGFAIDRSLQPDAVVIIGKHKLEAIAHGIALDKYYKCDTLGVFGGFDVEIFRPELPWHSFKTVTNYDKNTEDVYVYRKN